MFVPELRNYLELPGITRNWEYLGRRLYMGYMVIKYA